MTYINPCKWLVVNYRPGSGGKFLCLALTTIEKIAHWNPDVEFQTLSWENYIKHLWQPDNKELWLASEPITSWDLTFFSRTMLRGEELSLSEFDNLCKIHGSQYFKKIWETDKILLDFLNKETVPIWWKQSKIIKLDADIDDPKFKKRLLEKIYIWHDDSSMGRAMMDKPMPEQKYQNAALYKNKWEHGPFSSEEEWINWVIKNDKRVNFNISNPDIIMHDLLDFQKIYRFLIKIANSIGSTVDYEKLKLLHDHWITCY